MSPAVEWKYAPQGTQSFALSLWHIAPNQEKSYWVVYNIPVNVTQLAKNGKGVGKLGLNDKKRAEYDPMCSKGPGVKLYHITVYALFQRRRCLLQCPILSAGGIALSFPLNIASGPSSEKRRKSDRCPPLHDRSIQG